MAEHNTDLPAAMDAESVRVDAAYKTIWRLWGQHNYAESGRLLLELGLEKFVSTFITRYNPRNSSNGRSNVSARQWATWIYEKASMLPEAAEAMRGLVGLISNAEEEVRRYESLAAARRT